jgi:predicted ATPase
MPAPIFTRAPLTNRFAELAALRERLDLTVVSQGSTILVAGEWGIGKSRIVEEAIVLARGAGFRTGLAGCAPFGSMPFGPIFDLVTALDSGEDGDEDIDSPASGIAEVYSDRSNQGAVNAALLRELRRHARRGPLLLALEDVQWADQSTLGFIGHVVPPLHAMPVLLIQTIRTESDFSSGVPVTDLSERYRRLHDDCILVQHLEPKDTRRLIQTSIDAPL